MGDFFQSKKVKATVIGLIVTVLMPFASKAGIEAETIHQVLAGVWTIVGAYVIGQGVADGLSGGKTSSANGKG